MAGGNGKGKAVAMQADNATGASDLPSKKLRTGASSKKKNPVSTSNAGVEGRRKRGRPSKNIPRARANTFFIRSPTFPGQPLLIQRPLIPPPRVNS